MDKIQDCKELDIYFQDVDHADIKTIKGKTDLRTFVSRMLSYYPWWILALYRIRELMVKVLGLKKHEKHDVLEAIRPEDLAFRPGENAAFFIVKASKEEEYWVAKTPEDRHLKAYLGVVAEKLDKDITKFHVFTSVKYKHWTGPVYFNLIRPFHHLVVFSMMKAGIKS